MFKLHKVLSVSLVMFFASSIVPNVQLFDNKAYASTAKIATIDPALQYQTMDGWGTSLSWWGKLVGDWNTNAKNEIMDLAFDKDKGLGLNIVRYNIGGSKSPLDTNLRPGGDVESYLLENGTYDWTKDAGQRWTLSEAKKRIEDGGDKFISEAFSNSPPYFMTKSGQATGYDSKGSSNLDSTKYDQFADYMTEVVKHFRDSWGITFNTVEPTNEPSSGYWKKGGNQEGCVFKTASEKDGMYQTMSQKIKAAGLTTKIAGFDETSLDQSIASVNNVQSATLGVIDQLNTHLYGGNNTERTTLRDKAASLGKPLYMDEVCISGPSVHDHNNMDNGLQLAQIIFDDLKYMKVPAWDIWQVVDDEPMNAKINQNWGLIHAYWQEDKTSANYEKYYLTKEYYAMAQFSKYIRPGYKIIEANNSDVVAAIDPASEKLVLVTRNSSTNSEPLTLDLSRFDTTNATVKAYRTTGTESLADISSEVAVTNGSLTDTLPAKSMVTYVISNAKYSGEVGTTINDNVIGTNNSQYSYNGSWGYYNAQDGAYSNDTHYSNTKDSYYQVKFKGNRIKLYGSMAPDSGIAAISIDGGAETNVDLYSSARKDNALMYMSPLLTGGSEHIVKVRVTGNKNSDSSDAYIGADRAVAVENSTDNVIAQKPQLTQLIAGYNKIYVKYDPIEGAASYNIKYGTTPGNYTKVINNVTDTSYTITGLDNGTKYYIAVSAVINGVESENSNELTETPALPANPSLLYYVNCGDASPNELENGEVLGINNSNQDQAYGVDSITGYKWGYIADEGKQWSKDDEAAVGSNYGCLRQYDGNLSTGGLTYKFDVPNGKYSVVMGFYDPWSHDGRLEDILVNGNMVAQKLCPNKIGKVSQNYTADVTDGILNVRVQRDAAANDKPMISWIKVIKTQVVSYDANGGVGTVPIDTNIYSAKDTVTVQPNTLTKEGYTFVGWNTKTNGTGTPYTENATFLIGDSDVTLYAQWKSNAASTATTPAAVEITRDDDTLTANLKNSDGSEFFTNDIVTYNWYRDNTLIGAYKDNTYKLTNDDKGKSIKVKIVEYDLMSKAIDIPNDLEPVTTPSAVSIKIEGIEQVGNTLSAKLIGETTTGASVTYKWYSLDNSSSEYVNLIGTGKTYELISKDAGKYVGLIATYAGKELEPKKTGMIEAAQSTSTDVATTTTTSTSHKHHNSSSTSNNETITDANQATTNNNQTTTTNNNDNSTVATEGWNQSLNEWKYIKNGQPATGWNKIGNLWYLMDSEGIMQTGWKQTDNKWYFLKENGSMVTGWIQLNNQWYYLQENGEMAIGWVQSNGEWYYLYSNGSMASNTVIDSYKVNENGTWVR